MHAILSSTLFAALLLATQTAAQSFTLHNNCGQTVNLADVCGQSITGGPVAPGARASLSVPNAPGGAAACSTKVNMDDDWTDVLQFEYSIGEDGNIWYDLSAQNGDPFFNDNRAVYTRGGSSGSDSSPYNCPEKWECEPGSDSCAFTGTMTGGPTFICSIDTELTLKLC